MFIIKDKETKEILCTCGTRKGVRTFQNQMDNNTVARKLYCYYRDYAGDKFVAQKNKNEVSFNWYNWNLGK